MTDQNKVSGFIQTGSAEGFFGLKRLKTYYLKFDEPIVFKTGDKFMAVATFSPDGLEGFKISIESEEGGE